VRIWMTWAEFFQVFENIWEIISGLWKPAPPDDVYDKCVPLYGLKDPTPYNSITTQCPRCRVVLAIPLSAVYGFAEPIVVCPCGCAQKLRAK